MSSLFGGKTGVREAKSYPRRVSSVCPACLRCVCGELTVLELCAPLLKSENTLGIGASINEQAAQVNGNP